MFSRIPLRLRLTLVFAGVMAAVLAGVGTFLRVSVGRDLDTTINQSLQTRAADVGALAAEIRRGQTGGQSVLTEGGATDAQILDLAGHVLDATPLLRSTPLVSSAEIAAALRGPHVVERDSVPGFPGRARLLTSVTPAVDGRRLVVVVGAPLDERDEAVRNLDVLLAIGGPIALLLASAAGYGVASAALRPVDEMRRRAAAISGENLEERLPVGPANDEIRRLGETLNLMIERIENALAHERTFVADASHELRTPLAILKAELELALRGEHTAAELRAAIASAEEETDRLTRLAEDLLVMARSDQGGLPVHREPLDVGTLLADIAARFASRAREADRDVTSEAGDEVVVADRLRLEQALANLVENALRHGAGPVRLWSRRSDGLVELHVTDAGPGPPEDFIPQAFDRFSRADAARQRGGAGLGLSIVRAVARTHGGDARLEHLDGGGFDACLWIPNSTPAAAAPAQRDETG